MSEPHVDSGAGAENCTDLYKLHFRDFLTLGLWEMRERWLHYNQKLIVLNRVRRDGKCMSRRGGTGSEREKR